MGTVTLRPDSDFGYTSGGGTNTIFGGSASFSAAENDNNDSTYVQQFYDSGRVAWIEYGFPAPTIPANAIITAITPRCRFSVPAGQGSNDQGKAFGVSQPGSTFQPFPSTNGAITTMAGPAVTNDQVNNNQPWTATSIDDHLVVRVNNYAGPVGYVNHHEIYADVTYNEVPTVTATAPSGDQSTGRPTVAWTFADPDGDNQGSYRIKVFPQSAYSTGGFDPATNTNIAWDSGVVYSNARSVAIGGDLQPGLYYRAYVWVGDAPFPDRMSVAPSYTSFYVKINAQAAPFIEAIPDVNRNRFQLNVKEYQNQFDNVAASFEGGLANWYASSGGNSTIALVSGAASYAIDGGYVLRINSSGAGYAFASSAPGASGFAVVAGNQYSAAVNFLAASAGQKNTQVSIEWWDASNNFLSKTTNYGATPQDSVWRNLSVTAVAPNGAVRATVQCAFQAGASGESIFVDGASFVRGNFNSVWNPTFDGLLDGNGLPPEWLSGNSATNGTTTWSIDKTDKVAGDQSHVTKVVGATSGFRGVRTGHVIPCVIGQTYTLSAWVKTSRAINVQLTMDRTGTIAQPNVPANVWTRISVTMVATSSGDNSFYVQALVTSGDTSDFTMKVGHVQVENGATVGREITNRIPWTLGGIGETIYIQRSIDGGQTWVDVKRLFDTSGNRFTPGVDGTGSDVTVYDYEAQRGFNVTYRIRGRATPGGAVVISPFSMFSTSVPLLNNGWVLKSLTDPSKNIKLNVHSESLTWTSVQRQAVLEALGRPNPIVISDVVGGDQLPVELSFLDDASYTAFETLRKRQETMLLHSSYGDNRYVRLGANRGATHMLNMGGVRKWIVSASFIEVDAP